jgi:nitroimidazol reductase NimA-like FMN-containing flavoprotein (pyridoxamine 5'-phosphate oxidase superfamily)
MPDAPTDRARVHRLPERAAYDRDTIEAILDEALICHVAWTDGEGRARALPTIHARVGDTLYLHGSRAARAWRAVAGGAEVCVVATIVDALVLARSAFHHSMNYRSVVVYGHGREVTDADELVTAARAITYHVLPGREAEARMPTADEFKQTILFAIPIAEASAKVRRGPPKDDGADLELPIWAGLLPLETGTGAPESSPDLLHGIEVPPYIARPHRPSAP